MEQPHPRTKYEQPSQVLSDETLTASDKLKILEYWDQEVTDRLRAIAEGMSSTESDLATSEEALADEQQKVHNAIEVWRERYGR